MGAAAGRRPRPVDGLTYRKAERGLYRPLRPGEVVADGGLELRICIIGCPCGENEIRVNASSNRMRFDDGGLLTIEGKVGIKARKGLPRNWCLLDVTGGTASVHPEAKCPGSDLANAPPRG